MALSSEDLWKSARDNEVVEAIGRWESTNEEGQRALIAEVKRRGLKIAVPEVTVRTTQTAATAPSPFPAKTALLMVVVVAIIVAIAALIQ